MSLERPPRPTPEEQPPDAESLTENTSEAEKEWETVFNKELGITYREKVIELPPQYQEKTGLKQIRRRELLPPFPDGFFRDDTVNDYEFGPRFDNSKKFNPVFEFLTDGRFPSQGILSHTDSNFIREKDNPRTDENAPDQLRQEGIYFQKIQPDVSRGRGAGSETPAMYFDESGNRVKGFTGDGEKSPEASRAIYEMSTKVDNQFYRTNGLKGPMYIFGPRNGAFREYLKTIIDNKETRAMLEKAGWKDEKISLIGPESDNYADAIIKQLRERMLPFKSEEDIAQAIKQALSQKVSAIDEAGKYQQRLFMNIDHLRLLSEGIAVLGGGSLEERKIPSVVHPDVMPLRWCHAELAIIPTRRSLNVLFFESDDKDLAKKTPDK